MPSFTSGDKEIRIDHYAPSGSGLNPAVVLVHGSGGPLYGLDPFAQQATNFGVHVFLVHYFDRTGHSWIAPHQVEPFFPEWMETLRDALTFVSRQPGVDVNRIGLLGFSLGSYLSLAVATQDSRIAAVAELFGGLPEHFRKDASRLPPVLILHGAKDNVVPITEAEKLERLLKENHVPYEKHVYSNQGHSLHGLAQLDAMRRVVGFFRKYLTRAA
jgi:dipeptidyl aminopeptidase/acylaminoacyl peptidase